MATTAEATHPPTLVNNVNDAPDCPLPRNGVAVTSIPVLPNGADDANTSADTKPDN